MKKRFIYPLACLTLGMGLATITSCSGDEPGGPVDPGSIKNPPSIITSNNGEKLLVTKIGNYATFRYDEKGMPVYVDGLVIDYENGIIKEEGSNDEYAKFAMNKNGYITALSYSEDGGTCNLKYSYDSNGLLEKITFDAKINYSEGDYSEIGSGSGAMTFTYSNQKLTKALFEAKSEVTVTEGGHSSKEKFDQKTSLTALESIDNPLRQYSNSFRRFVDIDNYEELCYVGFYGKAPANLPTKVEFIEEEYDDDYVSTYTYTFNPDGTIKTENGDLYQYMPLGTRSTFPYAFESSKNETKEHRHLFNFPRLRRAK